MKDWDSIDSTIEMVEYIAEMEGFISSEQQLSEQFDEMIGQCEGVDTDDTVAMNEAFKNWTDGLCKDGILHTEQYNTYAYIGDYS